MMSELSNTIMVTAAILIGSFFSYLLQFFLGRSLTVEEFGTFNALLSITAVVGVPATVFGTSVIKEIATLHATKQYEKIRALFWHSLVWSFALGAIFFSFFYLFQHDIFSYIKVSDQKLIFAFLTYLGLSFVWVIPYYFLQGLLKYKWFSLIVVITGILRFIMPVLMLLLESSVLNVFLGIIIGLSISFLLSLLFLKEEVWKYSDVSVSKELLFILKFSLPVMAVNLCLMSFINSDLILVRTRFSEQLSGYYAGVITLGKILLFGSMPVATVMYPKMANAKSNGSNLLIIFKKFFYIQVLVALAGFVVFSVFPKFIALGFFGQKFLESVTYLPLYSIFVVLYILVNFLILFLLAVDKTNFHKVLIALAFTQIILISRYPQNLYQVLQINIGILGAGLLWLAYVSYDYLKSNKTPIVE